jgi:hypothetical protein
MARGAIRASEDDASGDGDTMGVMRRVLAPWVIGISAVRHLAWYLSYQITGEAREGD